MKRNIGIIAGLAALALAGCGSKDASDDASSSAEQVKLGAAKLEKPQPGEYSQVVEITKLEVPGLPAEASDQMRSALTAAQQGSFCLTKAHADRGYKDMFNDVGQGNQCTYTRFDVDGGTLDAQMECRSQQQGKATMKMSGTVTRDGSDITVVVDATGGPPPIGAMKMTMHRTTTRLGECKGS